MIEKIKYHWAFLIILLSGFVLRLIAAFSHAYSNDELSAVNRLRYESVGDLLEFGVMKGDMHPAGVQFFMKGWGYLFGNSEFVMRLPFIIAGAISLFLIYKIGLKWFDKRTAILATGLMAFLCFPIIQMELARPYSVGLMGVLMVTYLMNRVLFEKNVSWNHVIGLGISLALCMYTHYFALLFAGFLMILGFIFIKKETFLKFISAGLIAVLMFLPHIPITYYHLSVGGLQWLAPPSNNWLFEFVFYAFNSSVVLLAVVLVLSLVGFIQYFRTAKISRGIVFSGLAFFGIYLIGHVLSYLATPLLKYPVMIFAFPFLLFLLAQFISKLKFHNIIIPLLLIGTLSSTIIEKKLFEENHFATLKPLAIQIQEWQAEYKNQKITLFTNINDEGYINFYSEKDFDIEQSNFEYGEELKFRKLLKNANTFYCVFGYAARNTPVQFFETALEIYPGIVDGFKGYNSAIYLLHKRDSRIKQEERLLRQYNSRTLIGEWNFYESNIIKNVYLMDEYDMYGPDCIIPVSEIREDEYVKVSVRGQANVDTSQITIGVNVLRDGELLEQNGEIFWMGYDIDNQLSDSDEGYFAFTIPPFVKKTDQLKISLWNRGMDPFYLNSIGVSAKENIWNYFIP